MDEKLREKVAEIVVADPRYAADAYEFISDAVNYTSRKLNRARERDQSKRHISARELLNGISEYAVQEFGPMAGEVLKSWGLTDANSIGNVVFNMVSNKLLRANEKDSINDFSIDYNFDEALAKPFAHKKNKPYNPPIIA